MDALLFAVAAGFAIVTGINDGGTLLVLGLKLSSIRLVTALLMLALATAVVPLVFGAAVATTLAGRLVAVEGPAGQLALLAGVVAAVAVVTLLARAGMPTSLTLALVGGLAGAGLGGGFDVAWHVLGGVLLAAATAPMLGAVMAFAISRQLGRFSVAGGSLKLVRRLHYGAFGLQCAAYGANDGQKMVAVAVVAAGLDASPAEPPVEMLAGIAVLFLLGSVIGVHRFSQTVGAVIPVRPANAVTAQTTGALAVLGGAALGAPVSMTQAVAGGLVGIGMSESYRRVRWKTAFQIGLAWVITLPSALGAAALAAWVLR